MKNVAEGLVYTWLVKKVNQNHKQDDQIPDPQRNMYPQQKDEIYCYEMASKRIHNVAWRRERLAQGLSGSFAAEWRFEPARSKSNSQINTPSWLSHMCTHLWCSCNILNSLYSLLTKKESAYPHLQNGQSCTCIIEEATECSMAWIQHLMDYPINLGKDWLAPHLVLYIVSSFLSKNIPDQ